jgi:adiponectin receptor
VNIVTCAPHLGEHTYDFLLHSLRSTAFSHFFLGHLTHFGHFRFTMDTAKKAVSDAIEATKEVERTVEDKLTILWHEINTWQQDNHYILSGYRPQSNSYRKSFKSLGYLHNESVNIYTHLLGAIAILISSIVLYQVLGSRWDTATREDVWVFSCFFLGATACLSMSATFHTISNHSHEVARFGNQLDYAGIVFLIWGSFIPVLYYGFQSEPDLMKRYWAMVWILIFRG